MTRNTLVKTTIIVMLITGLSRCLGFLREILIGSKFGATATADAYVIALTIPNVIFDSIVSMAVSTVFIPVFYKIVKDEGDSAAVTFTNNLVTITTMICMVLTCASIIFSKQIISALAAGFTDYSTFLLASRLLRISILMISFINLTYIFSAYLQSRGIFSIPASIGLPSNIIIIAALIYSESIGIRGVVIGCLIGSIAQMLLVFAFACRSGFRPRFIFDLKDQSLKYMLALLGPVAVGISIKQVNTLIDRILASSLMAGSISALNFANKLNGFVYAVFSLSISTVVFPRLSSLNISQDSDEFKRVFISAINTITILMMPVIAGILILNQEIVAVLFERGAFTSEATRLTASALMFYSIGLLFSGYREILNRTFYSLHDTRTPMLNGAAAVIINIILNLILIRSMKHNGLALATSLSAVLTNFALFYKLRTIIGGDFIKDILIVSGKSGAASLCMGALILFMSHLFAGSHLPPTILLIIHITLGAALYFVLLYLLKVDEFKKAAGVLMGIPGMFRSRSGG